MDERITAHADLFALPGNETRLAIPTALDGAIDGGPVAYAELVERVGLDDSG